MRKSQLYSIAFGFSILVLLSFSLLLFNSLNSYSEYSALVEHTQVVMNNLQKIHSQVVDAETGQRGFLLTRDSSFLRPLLIARLEVPVTLDSLKQLTIENANENEQIDTLKAVIWEKFQIMEQTLNISPFISAQSLNKRLEEGRVRMDDFRSVINSIMKSEQDLLKERAIKKLKFERITPNYFKVIISITAIVSFVTFVLLMQELKQRNTAQTLLETRFHALNRSNAELQQITHVTSHDLQEPLRKIGIFSDALIVKFKNQVPHEVLAILKRINTNAFRVRELVADLSAFTSLSTPDGKIESVNLSDIIVKIQTALSSKINSLNAVIEASPIPTVMGYPHQLEMLFTELVSNGLKFSKPDVSPRILISSSSVMGKENDLLNPLRQYLMVLVADNGIGFEEEYSNRIFILFQKLHSHEDIYEGKGLGLSLCQRIMANHEGFITATGESGVGATFRLYFPL